MRHFQQPLFRTWLVTPAGRIKTIYFHGNVQSPLLDIGYNVKNGRVVGISYVRPSGAAEQEGYTMLEERFQDEDMGEEWAAWLDYQEHIQNMDLRQDFPEEMLPKAVLALRKGHEKRQWKPPVAKKAASGRAAKEA